MAKNFKVFLLFLLTHGLLFSQQNDLNTPVPFDTSILTGKLENGIPYFIMHNNIPKGRVEIRLVVNAGASDEDRDQLGLAHFLEHMAYRSTKHFPKSSVKPKLVSFGIDGLDANASTHSDKTIYSVKAPVNSDSAIKYSFLSLSDIVDGLVFDSLEFETERSILLQEWREEDVINTYKQTSFLLNKSRYARLPIGDENVLRTCTLSQLKRFYNDWYKPSLMAIIVVGDIDKKEYEKRVKQYFDFEIEGKSDRQKAPNNFKGYNEPKILVMPANYAQPGVIITYINKYLPDTNRGNFGEFLKINLIHTILTQRLNYISSSKPQPFFDIGGSYNKYWFPNASMMQYSFLMPNKNIMFSMEQFFLEIEKIKRHSASKSEFQRGINKLLLADPDADMNSFQVANKITDYYLYKAPLFPESWAYNFAKNYLSTVTHEDLKNVAGKLFSDSNCMVVFLPTFNQIVNVDSIYSLFSKIKSTKIEQSQDFDTDSFFVRPPSTTGRIIKKETKNDLGVTILTLSNNVKVYLKPTTFKKDEIIFQCRRDGGLCFYQGNDFYSAKYAPHLVYRSGYTYPSDNSLLKSLSGNAVFLYPFINLYNEGFSGYTVIKDKEIFFKMLHLMFTNPDMDDDIANIRINEQKERLRNVLTITDNFFNNEKLKLVFKNNNWLRMDLESDLDKVDYNRCLDIYKERLGNVAGFSFVFAGSFNVDSIKPLIVRWIGSLPEGKKPEPIKPIEIKRERGTSHERLYFGNGDKAEVNVYYFKKAGFDFSESNKIEVLQGVLKSYLDKILRIEMGKVYTTQVSTNTDICGVRDISINFKCAVKDVDTLASATVKIVEQLKEGNIEASVLQKVKQQILIENEENIQNNSHWISNIFNYEIFWKGKIKDPELTYEMDIKSVTIDDIRELSRKYFNGEILRIDCLPK